MPVVSKPPANREQASKQFPDDESSSMTSDDSDSSSENGDGNLSANASYEDTPNSQAPPTGDEPNLVAKSPLHDSSNKVLDKIETSPQTDLNKALKAKSDTERESFMLLLKDNVELKTSNDTVYYKLLLYINYNVIYLYVQLYVIS